MPELAGVSFSRMATILYNFIGIDSLDKNTQFPIMCDVCVCVYKSTEMLGARVRKGYGKRRDIDIEIRDLKLVN